MISYFGVELTTLELILVFFGALCAGANKGGIHGVALIAIPLLSSVLGVKAATGYVLLLFFISDCMAAHQYRISNPKVLAGLLPLALLGLALAAIIGRFLTETGFKIMVGSILGALIILLLIPQSKRKFFQSHAWIGKLFGFLGGFTSMAGNVGGPVLATYLISANIPKNLFLSTYSWFFFTINFIKLFIMIFYWKTITWSVAYFLLGLLPFIIAGFVGGVLFVKHIDQTRFSKLVTLLTILSCLYLFYAMLST